MLGALMRKEIEMLIAGILIGFTLGIIVAGICVSIFVVICR